MIFNISSGGVAYISVTAPTGAAITASCQGLELTGTGSCVLNAPMIGTWTVSCSYDGVQKTETVNITSFGQTIPVAFVYQATITVTTTPTATVTAEMTGQTTLTGTADSSGVCVLTVPAGGLGTWTVGSSLGSWVKSTSVNVAAYGNDYPVVISLSAPDFTFTTGGGASYTFDDNSVTSSNTDYYFYRSGDDWEFYAKVSGTIQFTYGATIDLFLCGGGTGGRSKDGSAAVGGNGGARKTISNITLGTGQIPVVIGGGSNGGNPPAAGSPSTFGDYTSAGGTVSSGAANYSTKGADGGYCFDDSTSKGPDGNSRKVGAGGGHGAYAETDGVNPVRYSYSNGGSYGGGKGGDAEISGGMTPYAYNGSNGSYYGAGGGGSGAYANTSASPFNYIAKGGNGYKGCVGMRNAR